jgi:hypothetical protein
MASTYTSSRRGSIYLPTLFVGMIVTTLALGGMMALRSSSRQAMLEGDLGRARALANSGIELAKARIKADPNWRTTQSNGAWLTNFALGGGTVSVSVNWPGGTLAISGDEDVVITAVGTAGRAAYTASCLFGTVETVPYTCLSVSVAAATSVTISSGSVGPAGQRVSANTTFDSHSSLISTLVDAGQTIIGTAITGTKTPSAGLKSFPVTADLLKEAAKGGTIISYTAIPSGSGGREFKRILLSPTVNPYGAVNSSGIYVIDCGGGKFNIEDSRIVGTLILRNASEVKVQGAVCWEPANAGSACLIVQGTLNLEYKIDPLIESDVKVNFNPVNSPYPYTSGSSDNDQTDSYPSRIDGLVYASDIITVKNSVTVHSLYTGTSLDVKGDLALTNDGRYLTSPPPGFALQVIGVSPGSHQQGTQ